MLICLCYTGHYTFVPGAAIRVARFRAGVSRSRYQNEKSTRPVDATLMVRARISQGALTDSSLTTPQGSTPECNAGSVRCHKDGSIC